MPKSLKEISKWGYLCVALGALFYFYEYFLRVSPSAMKPELMSEFDLDAALFGTLSAFYFYAYTPMQLIVGILVDRLNLRFVLSLAIFCCAFGTFLLSTADLYAFAALGRFLQGFGSAFAYIGALKLASMWLPAKRFGFFAGLTTSLGFWGAAFGEILLSALLDHLSWRVSLKLFSLAGVVLIILFFFALSPKIVRKAPSQGHQVGQHPQQRLFEYLWQFWVILKQPRIWVAGFLSALIFLPTTVFASLWGIPYLQTLHGYSEHQAAIASSMIFVGWALGCPIQGWISDRFGTRLKVIMVGAIVAAILSGILLYLPVMPYILVCILFVFFGFFSSSQVLTFAIARDLSNHRVVGMAVAFVNMLSMLGGTIFQSLVGKLLDLGWDGQFNPVTHERVYALSDYEHSIIIIPISLVLGALVAMFFRTRHKPGHFSKHTRY